ncbi:DUF4082 domain-containing protein [Actinoplanes sp. NPDC023714]|uniref:DUF4082 domain-containing protein n=1 Tax=Actinoplanes sp. NPDC023714 TaxID=3154322 RepID=UPI0033F020E2
MNVGGTIDFKVKTDADDYEIKIYRLGYYKGDGARYIDTVNPSVDLPQSQPDCRKDPATEAFECGEWGVSASWAVPSTAVSGLYIALLRREDTGGDSHIPFVVRNDASHSALFFKTSDATWQAYNKYGGSSFYEGDANGRAYKLSYNRPYATREGVTARDWLFANEYPMLRFLERNGYDISYTTDVDTDRYGSLIKNHRTFLSVGHDEYWSGPQRANVEAARDAGVNLAFFSGNEVYWRTRWEPSADGSNTPYRTLVSYKETWGNDDIDPSDEWTGTWRDPRFASSTAKGAGNPENGLTGTVYMSNHNELPLTVPGRMAGLRLWNNTAAEDLSANGSISFTENTVGYESDEDLDNGFRPAGLIRLSETTGPTPEYLRDFGNTVSAGTTTHHMTLYKADSGALVFSAGTIQYAWGLDEEHDPTRGDPADVNMQQATVNLLADMDAQPATLMSELQPATASEDKVGPTTVISSPAANTSVKNGAKVTLTGTASDTGGGVVAGVEVSTDGGESWHPAEGTDSWTYSFHSTGMGSQTVVVRGIDDSANKGEPASRQLTLTGVSTMFGQAKPKVESINDEQQAELGVRFTPQTDGLVTGIRFYKGDGNTGTHTGTLWTADGERIAKATFSDETESGWQQVEFSQPVNVDEGTSYIASYNAPRGHYSGDAWALSYGVKAGPLAADPSRPGHRSGLFSYGTGAPTESFQDTNYYVDVMFKPSATTPPSVVAVSPLAGAVDAAADVKPKATFSEKVTESSIQFTVRDAANAPVAGSVSYASGTRSATFTPAAALTTPATYTATVTASDVDGNAMEEPFTWTFTTDPDAYVGRLFPVNAAPATASVNDPTAVELGVKFEPATDGEIIGVRFYKGAGNTGTHTGSIWAANGDPITSAVFESETATGWQTVYFDEPVDATAGTTYVASYHAPNGHYAGDAHYFETELTRGQLSAPAGGNGVYRYGNGSFPNESYNDTNYWVDPLFVAEGTTVSPTTPSPSPSVSPSVSPSASPSVSPSVSPSASPSESASPSTSPSASPSTSPSASPSASPSVSPSEPLVENPTPTPPASAGPPVGIFAADATPSVAGWDDAGALEVGVRFVADVPGTVTGVRFYKGAKNTGTHTGTVWGPDGAVLATATFQDETASGWQTVLFDKAVTITPGVEYTASYHTTTGYYAVDLNGLADGLVAAPLRVPATGAVYRYGNGGEAPTATGKHNYWVDVLFVKQ